MQLAAAKHAAASVDGSAIVESILVDVTDNPPGSYDKNKPMKVEFIFVWQSGRRMKIKLYDTNPPLVADINPNYETGQPPSQADLQRYQNALTTVRISPRDVYQKTVGEGSTFKLGPLIGLYLEDDKQASFGVPVIWNVHFLTIGKELILRVSPESGDVLKRESN